MRVKKCKGPVTCRSWKCGVFAWLKMLFVSPASSGISGSQDTNDWIPAPVYFHRYAHTRHAWQSVLFSRLGRLERRKSGAPAGSTIQPSDYISIIWRIKNWRGCFTWSIHLSLRRRVERIGKMAVRRGINWRRFNLRDVELITLSLEVLKKLGLKNIELKLSHAGLIRHCWPALPISAGAGKVFDQILDGDIAVLSRLKAKTPTWRVF